MQTTVRIQRGGSGEETSLEEYSVACEPGSTVLDALRTIQRTSDPTLGFRWECRAGICGICAVMVDDQPRLSCETALEPGGIVTLAPLRGFAVIRDLIVDVAPALERLRRVRPYLVPSSAPPERIPKAVADRSKPFRRCIECFACVAATAGPATSESAALDPLGIVKLARFATDPRDGEDRPGLSRAVGITAYTPRALATATAACPKRIDIVAAHRLLLGAEPVDAQDAAEPAEPSEERDP